MQWQVMEKHKGVCDSMASRLPSAICMRASPPAASAPVRLHVCSVSTFAYFTMRSCTLRRIMPSGPRRNKYNEDVLVLATLGPRIPATLDGAGFVPFTTSQPVTGGPPPDDGGALDM